MRRIYLLVCSLSILGASVNAQFSGDGNIDDDYATDDTEINTYTVNLNHKLVLPCTVEGTEGDSILKWVRKSEDSTTQEDVVIDIDVRLSGYAIDDRYPQYNLIIYEARHEQAGKYTCFQMKKAYLKPVISSIITHRVKVVEKGVITGINPSGSKIYVAHNASLTLECKTSGNPKVYWTRQYRRFSNGEREHKGAVLHLEHANYKTTGTYTCHAVNLVGDSDFRSVQVIVKAPPYVDVKTPTVHSSPGRASKLVCIIDSYMPPTVKWYKNGVEINENNTNAELKYKLTHHHSLKFPMTTNADFGEYECRAENTAGAMSRTLKIANKYTADKDASLTPLVESSTHTLNAGQTVQLPCKASGISDSHMIWRRRLDGSPNLEYITYKSVEFFDKFDVEESPYKYTLYIINITQQDAGEYTCYQWKSKDDGVELVTHRINVYRSASIDSISPQGNTHYVAGNESITLECKASGFPVPVVTWRREGKHLPNGEEVHNGSTLVLGPFNLTHTGTYKCEAKNDQGKPATRTVQLFLQPHEESHVPEENLKTQKPDPEPELKANQTIEKLDEKPQTNATESSEDGLKVKQTIEQPDKASNVTDEKVTAHKPDTTQTGLKANETIEAQPGLKANETIEKPTTVAQVPEEKPKAPVVDSVQDGLKANGTIEKPKTESQAPEEKPKAPVVDSVQVGLKANETVEQSHKESHNKTTDEKPKAEEAKSEQVELNANQTSKAQ